MSKTTLLPHVDVVADLSDVCGECPVWDPVGRSLYWTDCVGLRFQRFDWSTGLSGIVRSGIEIYGFRRNRAGGFVLTNLQGVWLWDAAGDPVRVAHEADGSRLQLNDCTADSAGRLLTASIFYDPGASYELGKLVRIDPDGHAAVLDEGFHLANGLGLAPDEGTLYATDSVARRIYGYDYDARSGAVRNRRVFVQVPDQEGIPDGLAVDAEGFVWSAQWYGGCIVRYDPEGKEERRIPVPARQTSSLAFGGADRNEIFVTSAAKSEVLPVMPAGYDPNSGTFGGPLFRIQTDIQGQEQLVADIRQPVSLR
jgi:sugar lactone lactonase YvrE